MLFPNTGKRILHDNGCFKFLCGLKRLEDNEGREEYYNLTLSLYA